MYIINISLPMLYVGLREIEILSSLRNKNIKLCQSVNKRSIYIFKTPYLLNFKNYGNLSIFLGIFNTTFLITENYPTHSTM